jgi:hypothetical protein
MKTPNSTMELADAIESLVASYLKSVRDCAQQAVERAIGKPVAPPPRSSSASRPWTATSTTARRTATELQQVCDALCERVRAQPGASMVELARADERRRAEPAASDGKAEGGRKGAQRGSAAHDAVLPRRGPGRQQRGLIRPRRQAALGRWRCRRWR